MPAFYDLDLIVNAADPQLSGLLAIAPNNQVARGNVKVPDAVRGDQLNARFRLVQPSSLNYRQFDDVDLSGAVVSAAIGSPDEAPSAGTFYLKVGNAATAGLLVVGKRYLISGFQAGDNFLNVGAPANATGQIFVATGTTPTTWTNLSSVFEITTDLAATVSSDDLAAALNVTNKITAAGGVTVLRYATGDFGVAFNLFGAQHPITGDGAKLLPLSIVSTTRAQEGSAGAIEIQSVHLVQNPYCFAIWNTAFPPAGYNVQQLQVGDGGKPSIQRLTLSPAPYAGTFAFVLGGTSRTARYNLSETDMQALVGSSVVVTKTQESSWDFQWVANGAQAAITANVAGLSVPTGVIGTMALNTIGLFQAFAVAGATKLSLLLEIKIQYPGFGTETKLQLPMNVARPVADPGALIASAVSLAGITYVPNLTGLRGSATTLERISTAVLATDSLVIAIINGVARLWQLVAGPADVTDPNGQVNATDYDVVTNNRHLAEVL